jgi:hypothetical protein
MSSRVGSRFDMRYSGRSGAAALSRRRARANRGLLRKVVIQKQQNKTTRKRKGRAGSVVGAGGAAAAAQRGRRVAARSARRAPPAAAHQRTAHVRTRFFFVFFVLDSLRLFDTCCFWQMSQLSAGDDVRDVLLGARTRLERRRRRYVCYLILVVRCSDDRAVVCQGFGEGVFDNIVRNDTDPPPPPLLPHKRHTCFEQLHGIMAPKYAEFFKRWDLALSFEVYSTKHIIVINIETT